MAGAEGAAGQSLYKGAAGAVKSVGKGVGDLAESELHDVLRTSAKAALSSVDAPVTGRDAAVKLLEDGGVRLTYGQRLGGHVKDMEDKATSVPVTGNAIIAARKRGLSDWNVATANQILSPVEEKVTSTKGGHDLVREMNKILDKKYDDAYGGVESLRPDHAALQEIRAAVAQHAGAMNESDQALLNSIVKSHVEDRLFDVRIERVPPTRDPYGLEITPATTREVLVPRELNGRELQHIKSRLRTEQRAKAKSDKYDPHVAWALEDADTALGNLLTRYAPEAAEKAARADEAYAGLVRMEEAAAARVTSKGVFTPTDFLRQSRRLDTGVRNKNFAKGEAMLQRWSEAAHDILPSEVPDSGTAGRMAIPWLGTLVGASGLSPAATAVTAVAPLVGAAPYTEFGMRAIRGVSAGMLRDEASEILRALGEAP